MGNDAANQRGVHMSLGAIVVNVFYCIAGPLGPFLALVAMIFVWAFDLGRRESTALTMVLVYLPAPGLLATLSSIVETLYIVVKLRDCRVVAARAIGKAESKVELDVDGHRLRIPVSTLWLQYDVGDGTKRTTRASMFDRQHLERNEWTEIFVDDDKPDKPIVIRYMGRFVTYDPKIGTIRTLVPWLPVALLVPAVGLIGCWVYELVHFYA